MQNTFATESIRTDAMKRVTELVLLVTMVLSCSKVGSEGSDAGMMMSGTDYAVAHEMIVLGGKLDNPYTTENVRKAYTSLYPTRSRSDIETTNLYVRFLPETPEQLHLLYDMGLELTDHPVDYEIVTDGDYYHDPEIDEDMITWQYAVVPKDFEFPSVKYEILDECFIADDDITTRSGETIDWLALESEAYRITGNGDMLAVDTKKPRVHPSGRITIVDEQANGGKPFGVSGVRVRCNTFVKISYTFTDRGGYYTIPKKISAIVRYRLVFKNEKGFSIGFNRVIVPASTSALGKTSPQGLSVTITKNADSKLFNRSVVNNAAYDYISRCSSDDMDIALPPSDLRIWLFPDLTSSSAVMIHHGAVVDNDLLSKYLGVFCSIVKFFAPDITIGTKWSGSYNLLYSKVCHELSHASHYSMVGNAYWNKYIYFILSSYISTGGSTYGTGKEADAGYCEVGEMWAYYLESLMYQERYGGPVPSFGTSYWFRPQVFRYLDERGISRAEIFRAVASGVSDRYALKVRLMSVCPGKSTVIDQAFSRYY